jgi:hypothetical protein
MGSLFLLPPSSSLSLLPFSLPSSFLFSPLNPFGVSGFGVQGCAYIEGEMGCENESESYTSVQADV